MPPAAPSRERERERGAPQATTRAARLQEQQQQREAEKQQEEKKEDESGGAAADKGAIPTRTIDVYWQSYPQETVWIRKSRREKAVKETKSRMPLVLRNLAPDTAFDPRVMWEAEKKRAEDAAAEASSTSAAPGKQPSGKGGQKGQGQKGQGGKGAKAKKPSKKEEMIEKNKREQEEKDVRSDLEKLENAAKSCRSKAQLAAVIMAVKCATPLGKLRQLLSVLDAELKEGNEPAALDALWAVEASPLYCQALEQEDDLDDEAAEKGDASSKKDKKSSKSNKDSSKSSSSRDAPRSAEGAAVREFRKELKAAKKVREKLGKKHLARFQLEQMYDRLPPLSPFLKGWKLDAWQKRVLRHVDARKSAIVCAPTSSGKTVISTYTCVNYARVLFVVPTEPLVWQVAAMFEKLLQGSGQVALATNQLAYRPSEDKSRVVVGTPLALESSLVKIRGVVGDEATSKRWDYAQLEGGFDDFEYAVFDEVHALDGEEGAALQRLVRSVTCPTLALSATIGNATQLRDWWQAVRDDARHQNSAASKGAETSSEDDRVELVEHKGRFINVQNLVLDANGKLERLHPCAALTASRLVGEDKTGSSSVSLALTPADASHLYAALAKAYGDDAVGDLEPSAWFARLADDEETQRLDDLDKAAKRGNPRAVEALSRAKANGAAAKAAASARSRITLDNAKRYEQALKERLADLARASPDKLDADVLDKFVPDHLRDDKKKPTGSAAADAAAPSSPARTPPKAFSLLDVATQMRQKLLFPALAFHLDSFHCLGLFKTLVAELERAEKEKYPNWAAELRAKADANEKKAAEVEKLMEKNAKKFEDDARDGFDAETDTYVDETAPHPEFVLAPPTARLSAKEIDDILDELKKDTQGREQLGNDHVLVRALRRGFAVYIDDAAFAVYRRVVQRLAQQGKLAIVFSDASLAYGVNMPFRTVAFCGDEGGLLTALLAQQMAGRAGRRGLDTQGNLVYLGMDWDRIKRLIIGTVPAIEGRDPAFPTMAVPFALGDEIAGPDRKLCDFVDRRCLRRLCASTLAEFVAGKPPRRAADCDAKVDELLATLEALGLRHTTAGADGKPGAEAASELAAMHTDARPKLCMVWELRDYLAESVALAFALPHLMADFVKDRFNFKRAQDDADSEAVQIEFLAVVLHLVDRTPPKSGATPLGDISWLTKSPDRVKRWDRWETLLVESQARLDALPNPADAAALRLAVPPGAPIDASVFEVAKDRRLPAASQISSLDRHRLKQRIWHVGNILMKMHNCLQMPGEYITLSPLLRKCTQRIKYILSDDINANVDEKDVEHFLKQRLEAAAAAAAEEPPAEAVVEA